MRIVPEISGLRRWGAVTLLLIGVGGSTAGANQLNNNVDEAIHNGLDDVLKSPNSYTVDSIDFISRVDGSVLSYAGRVTYSSGNTIVTVPFTGEMLIAVDGTVLLNSPVSIQWDAPTSTGEGGATDISGDPFVTGYLDHGSGSSYHAFLYDTETAQTLDLGALTEDGTSIGHGVSYDGGVVAGGATVDGGWQHAFRWTEADGMVDLGSAAGGSHDQARAMGISDDGAVVFGASDFLRTDGISGTVSHAFAWTLEGGYRDLGVIGNNNSIAMAATPDGSTIVGGGGNRAFRWTDAKGMVDLGAPKGADGSGSIATGVSHNGKIVVGNYSTTDDGLGGSGHVDNFGNISHFGADGTMHAFRWTDAADGGTGMADLRALMVDSGVDMSGIDLVTATGISGDGQYIYGRMTTAETVASETVLYFLQYCDDFVDACTEGGITTPEAQTVSVQELADARAGISEHLGATAGLLLGSLQPVLGSSPNAGGFGGVGSLTGGVQGRWDGNGLSLFGGLALTSQEFSAVDIDRALLLAGGTRYVWQQADSIRPFVEAGGWLAPGMNLTFRRDYANGSGTATGLGETTASAANIYGKAGVIWTPLTGSEIALAGIYMHNWLQTGAYAESGTGNPFPAIFSTSTQQSDVLKLSASYTQQITDELDVTVMAAIGRAFTSGRVKGSAGGVGSLSATPKSHTLGELGVRVGYELQDRVNINAFALASTGTTIETHVTVGGGLSVSF